MGRLKQIALKASSEEHSAWVLAAGRGKLGAWIRGACNERVAREVVTVSEPAVFLDQGSADDGPMEDEVRSGDSGDALALAFAVGMDYSRCVHPAKLCLAMGRALCGGCREANEVSRLGQ